MPTALGLLSQPTGRVKEKTLNTSHLWSQNSQALRNSTWRPNIFIQAVPGVSNVQVTQGYMLPWEKVKKHKWSIRSHSLFSSREPLVQKSSQFVFFFFSPLYFVHFCCDYQDNYHQCYLLRGTAVSLLLKTFEQKPGLSLLRHAFAFPSVSWSHTFLLIMLSITCFNFWWALERSGSGTQSLEVPSKWRKMIYLRQCLDA